MHSAHNQVITVSPEDIPTGLADKMQSHLEGTQHRAFSIFLYRLTPNHDIELLLQQRHAGKYHSANLWTNTCCSHPMHLESPLQASHRRLREELNLENIQLRYIDKITYHVTTDTLSENEIDYVFIGELTEDIQVDSVNPQEISALKWMGFAELQQALIETPQQYTSWLPHVMQLLSKHTDAFQSTMKEAA